MEILGWLFIGIICAKVIDMTQPATMTNGHRLIVASICVALGPLCFFVLVPCTVLCIGLLIAFWYYGKDKVEDWLHETSK